MVNKQTLVDKIIYYKIHYMIIAAIILAILREPLINIVASSADVRIMSNLYNLLNLAITGGMIFLWGYFSFTTLRDQRYTLLTDRSYPKDHGAYNKSYYEMVEFYKKSDPYKMDINQLPIQDWHKSEGVILGKIKDKEGNYHLIRRKSNENGNLVCFGLPGSGKSTTQAAPTALRFNNGKGGVFAISIKGDMLNFVKGKRKHIKVITPDKEEGSCHYNPLQDYQHMDWTMRRNFVEMLSNIVVPEESGDNAKFFYGGARDYFCAITLYLMYKSDVGEIEELKFHDIVDTILSRNVFEISEEIQASDCDIAGEYTNSYIGNSEKNVAGIYNHLAKHVRPFNNGALRTLLDGKGNCITPEDLEHGDVYIDIPQEKFEIYAPVMAIIVSNFMIAFMSREDVSSNPNLKPIIFLLDEAVQLNLDFKVLSQAMSTLRSKKVSIFLLMQSIAQLEGRYGEAHAREIMDLCAYISVINAQDPKSRKYFQELVGMKKEYKRNTSLSTKTKEDQTNGVTVSEVDEYIFKAADFGDLRLYNKKKNEYTNRIMVYANGKYALAETTPCYE